MVRAILVFLHRYLGLAMAVFLAMAGLTGSILAFSHEIDEWLNPEFYVTPGPGTPLSLDALAARAQADHPQMKIYYVESEDEAGADHPALAVGEPIPDPVTGVLPELDYNWVYLDPATGETMATRYWARCCFEAENFIPFIYEFHHTLTLPGTWGFLLMGAIAILWTLDCLIALFLTFPKGAGFFSKWKTAWQIKRGGGSYRLNLDLHRAGGLWLWLVLLPVAVSSVAMNLPDQVFRPLVSIFSPVAPSVYYQRSVMTSEELGKTHQSYADILERGRAESERLQLEEPLHALYFNTAYNYYAVGYGDDHDSALGGSWLFFDGAEGRLLHADIPGQGTAGEIFTQIQFPLHGGQIAGLTGRIIICITGLVIFMLSVTGIVIWWKKRRARVNRAQKAQQAQTAEKTEKGEALKQT